MPLSHHEDEAASPVVGMILVLAISAAATTAVLTWGLPAIGEMRADVEHRSIITEFREFSTDINELIRASASKTAKMWHFSQSQGDFAVLPKSERWAYAADGVSTITPPFTYDTTGYDLDTREHTFVLLNHGNTYNALVKADFVDGATSIPLKVDVIWLDPADPTPPDCPALHAGNNEANFPGALDNAGEPGKLRVCLYDQQGQPAPIEGNLLQVEVRHHHATQSNRETATWLWIGDVGRAQWRAGTVAGVREVYHTNGMLLHGAGTGLVLDGNPSVSPPKEHAGEWRFFARFVSLKGSAALGGEGTVPVLLNLYGGSALADEFHASSVKLWTYGDLADTWWSFFQTSTHDYDPTAVTENVAHAPAGTRYLKWTNPDDPAEGLKLILHQSTITVS